MPAPAAEGNVCPTKSGFISENVTFVIEADCVDDTGGGDHRHAFGDLKSLFEGDGVGAEVVVGRVAVADGLAASFPAAAMRAAVQGADRVEELVTGVHLPVSGFTSAGHND